MEGKPTESLLYYSPVNSGYIEQMPFPRQAIARWPLIHGAVSKSRSHKMELSANKLVNKHFYYN